MINTNVESSEEEALKQLQEKMPYVDFTAQLDKIRSRKGKEKVQELNEFVGDNDESIKLSDIETIDEEDFEQEPSQPENSGTWQPKRKPRKEVPQGECILLQSHFIM